MWGGGGQYAAWASFLERWAAGEQVDPDTLPALEPADFPGDGWERLTNRISDALSRRLRSWSQALARSMTQSRDEFEAARALGHARWSLQPIRALAGHPGLPTELAGKLVEAVDRGVRAAQQSLVDDLDLARRAGLDERIVQARLRTVRDNPLTVLVGQPAEAGPPGPTGWYADPTRTTRRRIIAD
ncbi:hypothetical protein ACQEVC_39090 [Plantactinospora sp. CA-294935]|uniref:hypothetical protein n=1 Tax=Plantactinospora sp. CA-294935 TaxID=3240012 RepID=UPI003D910B9D